jgi:hypothetical protein
MLLSGNVGDCRHDIEPRTSSTPGDPTDAHELGPQTDTSLPGERSAVAVGPVVDS